jgi:hypothetical protein
MSTAYVGDTIRIRVTFYSWDSGTGTSSVEDPVTVTFRIVDMAASPTTVASGTPTKESDGVYYYDWTPTAAGDFFVEFVGVFGDGSSDVVTDDFTVIDPSVDSTTTAETLLADETVSMAGVITPLCVNPDELVAIFPDATELDIAEAIWRASSELNTILKLGDGECPTDPTALDYIKAAAACELSRVFELGDGNEQSIALGDFSVTYRSFPKSSTNRGNATTWCELAAALRKEVIYKASSSRAFVHGSNYDNPIPIRKLRRDDEYEKYEPHKQGLLDGEPS